MGLLTKRWTILRPHPVQGRYWTSPHRFNIVSAGRRSGKTELAKRKIVQSAIDGTDFDDARFFAAAPTLDQARRIYWADFKKMVPLDLIVDKPSETHLTIELINGSTITVLGMDKPARIEGAPWDGGILDEYANMKEGAWGENVRPALADRNGWCDLIGVPEGRNHYFEMDERARAEMALRGAEAEFGSFTWPSADILPQAEIDAARRDLPPKVFQQEYEGSFVDWSGDAFFEIDRLLDEGKPAVLPAKIDNVFAVVDTAVKAGKEHDGTAVVFFGYDRFDKKLYILDWDIVQLEGDLLETWLPTVFARLEELARLTNSRQGASGGVHIEDKQTGSILIQQGRRRGWPTHPIDTVLTSVGKDERAISVSGYVWQRMVLMTQDAYDKVKVYKGVSRNHFLTQVGGFKIGAKDGQADDLLDCLTYGVSLALGNSRGW